MTRGRKPLQVGETSPVRYRTLPSGTIQAIVNIRDPDGRTRAVTATGKSKGAAERALQQTLKSRSPVNTATLGSPLTSRSTVEDLTSVWIEHRIRHGNSRVREPLSTSTINFYKSEIRRRVVPAFGGLRLGELSVPLLQSVFNRLDDSGISTAGAHTVMSQMCTYICQLGIRTDNPMQMVATPPPAKREVKALTVTQAQLLRRLVQPEAMRNPGARRAPSITLAVAVDIALGTGARMAEVLALRWDQVDLDDKIPTVRIDATLIEARGDVPFHRQSWTKSHDIRTLILPDHVADLLREMRETTRFDGDADPVVTNSGTYLYPTNVRRMLTKAVKGTELVGTVPHTLRRTVGTLIAHERGIEAAAAQLGHSAGTSTTAIYYVARRQIAPDLRDVLNWFFGEED